jgi:hypothetical protein
MKTVRIEPTNCYELTAASLRIEQGAHRKIMPSTRTTPSNIVQAFDFSCQSRLRSRAHSANDFPGLPQEGRKLPLS